MNSPIVQDFVVICDDGDVVVTAPSNLIKYENSMDLDTNNNASPGDSKPNTLVGPSDITLSSRIEESFSDMIEELDGNSIISVVIDAANIGWAHGHNVAFSSVGIKIAVDYFKQFGDKVSVKCFLPSQYYRRRPVGDSRGNAVMQTNEWEIIDTLVSLGTLIIVPAGDSDDEYIITYARLHNGFVVSNDFYSDHVFKLQEPSIRASCKLWLTLRRCSFVFTSEYEFMLKPDRYLTTIRH